MQLNQPLELLFKTFQRYPLDEIGLNVYAIADAAQDKSFLKVLEHLRQKCLLIEASGEKAKAVSPHLLQLPKDFSSVEWDWIQQKIAGTPKMTILISPLSFDYLFEHLRHFLEVQFEGGLEMILAFWDPIILAPLVGRKEDQTLYISGPILTKHQVETLLEPIQSWWYWDRLGFLQTIFGLNERVDVLPQIEVPIKLNVEQEEMLVEASFPDNLIYYLKLNNSFLIEKMDDYALYQFVIKTIPEAREFQLSGTRDILNFICLKLIDQDNFYTDLKLKEKLEKMRNKQITIDGLMSQVMTEMI
ncbi:DUF4123 domain-containing protein [Acinetobacter ursingii]|uniref:DUF4123 domain-containing protein n=1 Tax=Acinetobacter ursingii TaxID=108980 RepID=UPI00124DF58E|nr:DUF4123 domain-containing protein [Acinetobacter ursingii]